MQDRPGDDFILTFEGSSEDEAGLFADDLRRDILDTVPGVTATRRRSDAAAMDFGATLGLIVGTSAATSLAHGISQWLARNSGVTLRIETADGTVVAEKLNSVNAQGIAAAVFSKKRR